MHSVSQRPIEKAKPNGSAKPRQSAMREWFHSIVFAVVVATLIRWLFMEAFVIPTPSMEGSLLVGDYLFVSKMHYGTRFPRTPLQLPLMHQTIWGTKVPSYLDWIELPYYRLPGFSQVQRGDVVVFNYPMEFQYPSDVKSFWVKRCVGLPGDTVRIDNAQLYANGEALPKPVAMQFSYLLATQASINERTFRKWKINEYTPVQGGYMVLTTPATAQSLQALPIVDTVIVGKMSANAVNSDIYPDPALFAWNRDYFGPLWVPSKGATIPVTQETMEKYGPIIRQYEGHTNVKIEEGTLLIEGQKYRSYTFRQDYYFMVGDNRHNSLDSRFLGIVPDDHIVGKPLFIWMSLDAKASFFSKIRWERLFQLIE